MQKEHPWLFFTEQGGQVLLGETNIKNKSSHQTEAGMTARSKQVKKQANKHIEQASIHLVTRCILRTCVPASGSGGAAAVATCALFRRPMRTCMCSSSTSDSQRRLAAGTACARSGAWARGSSTTDFFSEEGRLDRRTTQLSELLGLRIYGCCQCIVKI